MSSPDPIEQGLKLKLHPLTKFMIWRSAKAHLYPLVEKEKVAYERAKIILEDVKTMAQGVKSPEDAEKAVEIIETKYPELEGLVHDFDTEFYERLDKVFSKFIEHIADKGNFDMLDKMMDEVKEFQEKHDIALSTIRNDDRQDFDDAVKEVLNENKEKE